MILGVLFNKIYDENSADLWLGIRTTTEHRTANRMCKFPCCFKMWNTKPEPTENMSYWKQIDKCILICKSLPSQKIWSVTLWHIVGYFHIACSPNIHTSILEQIHTNHVCQELEALVSQEKQKQHKTIPNHGYSAVHWQGVCLTSWGLPAQYANYNISDLGICLVSLNTQWQNFVTYTKKQEEAKGNIGWQLV